MGKILVVEDNLAHRETFRTILEQAGHTGAKAADGRQALQFLRNNQTGLIFIDIYKPEMGSSGFRVGEFGGQFGWLTGEPQLPGEVERP